MTQTPPAGSIFQPVTGRASMSPFGRSFHSDSSAIYTSKLPGRATACGPPPLLMNEAGRDPPEATEGVLKREVKGGPNRRPGHDSGTALQGEIEWSS